MTQIRKTNHAKQVFLSKARANLIKIQGQKRINIVRSCMVNKYQMLMFYPTDNSFKPFRMNLEFWDHLPVLTNNDLGIAVRIEENEEVCQNIEQELKSSWKKIVEEYDESKLIFKKLKKIRKNLLELKNN
jgi:hypothetical protein